MTPENVVGEGATHPPPLPAPTLLTRPRGGRLLAWTLLCLLPFSVFVVVLVLHVMAGLAADATGGCGGG
jgi:hypothetical protein